MDCKKDTIVISGKAREDCFVVEHTLRSQKPACRPHRVLPSQVGISVLFTLPSSPSSISKSRRSEGDTPKTDVDHDRVAWLLVSSSSSSFSSFSSSARINLIFNRSCRSPIIISITQLTHECLTPPMTLPLTCAQSILASSSSSTSPQTETFSPRIMYRPWLTSLLASSSSGGRMTRSMVWLRTRFVSWSQDRRVPVRVRPSPVRTRTFSVRYGGLV